ncbi:hypothetical protein [Streptomyces sp. NBC_00893]|uniref:hypothetical protein n=1 Tax=Streptomyces sp. NBC_00893 TaxID=2975862 RepID=UPI00225A705A|nr:hypothetical protein [Streptomyces sp. NBC_00893]MCX4849692.1 hypothetical protein [Streptomyces sp. NBC_00893]
MLAPVVLTTFRVEERTDNWRVVSLGAGGKVRTSIDARPKGFRFCTAGSSSLRRA